MCMCVCVCKRKKEPENMSGQLWKKYLDNFRKSKVAILNKVLPLKYYLSKSTEVLSAC